MENPSNDSSIPTLRYQMFTQFRLHNIYYLENQPIAMATLTGTPTIQPQPKSSHHVLTYRTNMFVPSLKSWLKKWTTSTEYYSKQLFSLDHQNSRKKTIPTKNPDTGLEVNRNIFISVPYVSGLSEELRKMFQHTRV